MAKKRSKVGLRKGRIDWDNFINVDCIHLASYGFHGETIAKATGLTRLQVYTRIHRAGFKLRDYRNGIGPNAKILVTRFSVKSVSSTNKEMVRQDLDADIRKLKKDQTSRKKTKSSR